MILEFLKYFLQSYPERNPPQPTFLLPSHEVYPSSWMANKTAPPPVAASRGERNN